jgi:hypothetical protein
MTRAFNEVAGALFDRYAVLEETGIHPPSAHPSVIQLARYVLICRMEELLSSQESDTDDLDRLIAAFSDWGITETSLSLNSVSGRFITRSWKTGVSKTAIGWKP